MMLRLCILQYIINIPDNFQQSPPVPSGADSHGHGPASKAHVTLNLREHTRTYRSTYANSHGHVHGHSQAHSHSQPQAQPQLQPQLS